jgi:hypothetical protein
VRLPDGTHAAIAMSLTNYLSPVSELPVAAAHLLDLGGLRQVVQVLDRLRAEGRFPPTQYSDAAEPVEAARYD